MIEAALTLAPLKCVGCGKPADMEGYTKCGCTTGIIATRARCDQFYSADLWDKEIERLNLLIVDAMAEKQWVANECARRLTT